MENEAEKKSRRPRIGSTLAAHTALDHAAAQGETTHESVSYGSEQSGQNQGRPNYQSRNYSSNYNQNRQGGYRPYNRYDNNRPYNAGQRNQYNRQESEGHGREEQGFAPRRQYNNFGGNSNYNNRYGQEQNGQNRPYRPYNQQNGQNNRPYRPYNNRPENGSQQRPYRPYNNNRQDGQQPRPYNNRPEQGGQNRPYGNRQGGMQPKRRPYNSQPQDGGQGKRFTPRPRQIDYVLNDIDPNEPIRLNKYMANAGLCSRREADELITGGKVKVNGTVVTELGTKILRTDVVEVEEKVVVPERKCYVLLNKPKDCVTTSDDPNGRTTVLDIVKGACQERIYPVGRLDRNTTGVLLLTNDGDLASKLTHPKFVKKKIYHVWTDKDIAEEDMQRIADGIELEDGEIHADAISYVNETDRNQAGIEIHSGRNRIVRRMFEHLGYRVTKLDRVYFAGLTKKNLPRGRWRYLTQDEVNWLRQGSFE